MAMVRKQLYLDSEHDQKIKRLAEAWNVSEAEVVRRAIEGLVEYRPGDGAQVSRVREAATLAYGAAMEDIRQSTKQTWRDRRLDHDAWLEELAFIEQRSREAGAQGGDTSRFNREDAYDKRRMRLPD
jgi:hypothetical protein